MGERRGKGGTIPSEELLAEADRLAGASGPKRTKGGAGAYTAVELMEAHKSLRDGRKTPPMPFDGGTENGAVQVADGCPPKFNPIPVPEKEEE